MTTVCDLTAQSSGKIVRIENETGIINRGQNSGVGTGDVFEVSRFKDDFIYWIGRIEVTKVSNKSSLVRVVAKADGQNIQPGDVIEPSQRDFNPMDEKRTRDKIVPTPAMSEMAPASGGPNVAVGFSLGALRALSGSSESLGLDMRLRVNAGNNNRIVDMTRSYRLSAALRANLLLTLSSRIAVAFNYGFIPLSLKSQVESDLLQYGLTSTSSLMEAGIAVSYRYGERWRIGLGPALFLPQANLKGSNQSITVSERHFGMVLQSSYQIPLGATIWLQPSLQYQVFWNDGVPVRYLTLTIGPSFRLGNP